MGVLQRTPTACPWQTPCSHRASKSVCVHMEPKRHRIWIASSRLCSYQLRRMPLVPQQRPMDANRWRRCHRRRCLPPGRPRRGLRSVQQLAETAACCNDRRRTCSYTTADESFKIQSCIFRSFIFSAPVDVAAARQEP